MKKLYLGCGQRYLKNYSYLNEPLTTYRDDSSDTLRKEATVSEYTKYIKVLQEVFKRTRFSSIRYRRKLLLAYIHTNIKLKKQKI